MPGDVAVLFDSSNHFLAAGLYDPEDPTRVRVLVHDAPAEIGTELFRTRIDEALARKSGVTSHPD